ncbi:thiol:disulfide interchange protein DsbA/DsbL [Paraferrimonas sedimenticola]|uniref:Thiol:disulfide interchange protein n=1 Tax=Paraferrimonas sedimenticola TaxID=375674 RepID=A0AA37VT99_9GAMM|nr:thiol:disulfide interchange protein DsbA/DsbL [Paraferrimonas sedimenticola]GLP95186.1 thiol:disulfide interchange protein [Paraferrimonas sedimenticola]
MKTKAAALLLALAPMLAGAADFIQGKHYFNMTDEPGSATPKVTEFFSFYCGNCYNMETQYLPFIKTYMDSKIAFDTAHVDFMRSEIGYEVIRSLIVMQEKGVTDKLVKTMFATVQAGSGHDHHHGHDHGHDHGEHEDALDIVVESRDDIKAIFKAKGVDVSDYDAIADSAETEAKMKLWAKQEKAFGVRSVPSFVVNEKYLINMQEMRSLEEFAALINHLALEKGDK